MALSLLPRNKKRPFGQEYLHVRRVEPDFICKNLASAVISQKTREANHNKRCDLEVE
jgi:hypothetical protein